MSHIFSSSLVVPVFPTSQHELGWIDSRQVRLETRGNPRRDNIPKETLHNGVAVALTNFWTGSSLCSYTNRPSVDLEVIICFLW